MRLRALLQEARVLLGQKEGEPEKSAFPDRVKLRKQRLARLQKRYGASPEDYKDLEVVPDFDHILKKRNERPGRQAWTTDR
jgi:hypothetical protein